MRSLTTPASQFYKWLPNQTTSLLKMLHLLPRWSFHLSIKNKCAVIHETLLSIVSHPLDEATPLDQL